MVFLTLSEEGVPCIADEDRCYLKRIAESCYSLRVKFGFNEEFDVPKAIALCAQQGYDFLKGELSYFLGYESVVVSRHRDGMALWRKILYAILAGTQKNAAEHFHLPSNQVIRLASYIEI